MTASLLLAVLLAVRGPSLPGSEAERDLAGLQSPTEKTTGWLVETTAGAGARLVPVGVPVPAPEGKVLQIWAKPNGAKGPTSLGLMRAGEVAIVPLAQLPGLGDKQLFEVTLEPMDASNIGKPTGPVHYVRTTVHL